ncbi:hypothetical protein A3E97_05425 [Candidatus Uhrbacteria bacterium RIFCSPHIGHO2_12_FULL_47_12]|uniref:Glycosyltransferase 2-like domain-containing protein n=1 Tax=Candidatus Uhrbacteria bacterium RIFCSPLOWO2_02_FULL_48_18 TaxID=1802408 RepID=A0A1F7VAH7_9BACT|nr:MAG: hypothetical protein A2839_03665 [Candidatus Uhrbacteria bacterium RIFCSPHIGHO2_01_FULL_47_10]OGL77208.1 MAG: hypothetical protein A3E97_05425 [Candidatus Uhrbacteria bacterium RIFCSPHIGHO2_12_FULL_47_12]OGL81874.1 MAG: hypothetical protein A3B20_02170 [Candidatus Uhrbacteria bacterium RIFCSPLOWO2_01_FULL_47_17]OGL87037.1 MAG: hypothetical protein A3I41_03760 [Candidatus Uhrbacteria bacterium RIFCSPLOWO2_02_FULL_48_18]OGL92749.1 MAG: hypothetical protein A3H12_03735 [Candidatus Uhrbacte
MSVILPVFNAEKTIQQSIQSVLNQTFRDFELIVIDDGSTDETQKIIQGIQDARVICIKNEKNLGLQKTLNLGLQKAVGTYIARIDADDTWIDRNKLLHQISFLDTRPLVVLVGTGAVVMKAGQELFRFLNPSSDVDIRRILLGKNTFVHSSVVFKRDAALRVGGYSEDVTVTHVEDHDLWLKLGTQGMLANLAEYDIQYTLSETQISSRHKRIQFFRDVLLVNKYANKYPGKWRAWIRGLMRLGYYGFLK